MREIRVSKDLRELEVHGSPMFPVAIYDSDFRNFITGDVSWHWHEEVEISFVTRGVMELELQDRRIALQTGEGVFLNANTLHAMRSMTEVPCRIRSAVFDARMISGAALSVLEQKYVLPVVQSSFLDAIALRADIAWKKEALHLVAKACEAFDEGSNGFELRIRNNLSEIWYLLITNLQDKIPRRKRPVNDEKVKSMISFMQEYYMEAIGLDEIASAAGVSTRECNRCFKEQLGITPIAYLNDYRISVAAQLLSNSGKTITEICYAAGFGGTSYFSKAFKTATGVTPKEYRRMNK